MNKISNNIINKNQTITSIESPLTKTWNGLKIASLNGIEFASSSTLLIANGIVKGYHNTAGLTRKTAKTIGQSTATAGNQLYKIAAQGINATSNLLIKSNEVGNNLIQNKNLYLREVSRELNSSTVKTLGFIALGFATTMLLNRPRRALMQRWDLDITAPHLPKFLQDFSRNASYLEGSLPADKKSFTRVLVNRPLFFGTLLFGLTQEGLLKKLPEKILNKIAPSHASKVNSRTAKIARVALTAAIYSLASTLSFAYSYDEHKPDFYSVSKADLIWKFGAGAMYASIQEFTGNPVFSMATLLGSNLHLPFQNPVLIPKYPYYIE